MKIWFKMVLAPVLGFTLLWVAVDYLFFDNTTSWKEEVLLHDGRKIVVKRTTTRAGRHEIGQRPTISKEKISFTLPSSKQKIRWESEYADDIGYADISPIMLDIMDNTPYLVTETVGCLAYNKWGRPNPPYIVFRYTNTSWQQIEMKDLPLAFKVPNMIISSPDSEAKKTGMNPVSAEKIHELNSKLRQPEYKSISRKPVEVWCEKLIKYECEGVFLGWGSPGGISKKLFESECRRNQKH